MTENKKLKDEYKNPQKEVINFVNSIDYINKDISDIKNFNLDLFNINNEILDIDLDLNPYIKELNSRLNNEKISIKYEIELFE